MWIREDFCGGGAVMESDEESRRWSSGMGVDVLFGSSLSSWEAMVHEERSRSLARSNGD